ncbi:hypothetical protein Vadar_017917 [Vaccinium darrowii]|uniref:Uncharacterized protein n=1 Tax=Vaccinium darrowii TaxID=229202 RepID=A0ACB7ZK86_9ERIC|nr:hypothetical protein Vadar_017917 [Vaccinium darrowii]
MEITSQADCLSPLATIEDIRNRLVRPPSLHSPSPTKSTGARDDTSSSSCYTTPFDVNSIEFQRKRESNVRKFVTTRRLEDYLDPTLLSAARATIGGNRKRGGERKSQVQGFEWPVDELKVWKQDLIGSEEGIVMKWRSDDEKAVDLGDDHVDVVRGGGDDDDDDGGCCSPFQSFERTALKRFKRG